MSSLSLPLPMLSTPASQSVNASLIACLKKSTVIIILHFYKAQAEYKSCRRMTVRGQRSDLSPKITTVITYCHQPYYVTSKKTPKTLLHINNKARSRRSVLCECSFHVPPSFQYFRDLSDLSVSLLERYSIRRRCKQLYLCACDDIYLCLLPEALSRQMQTQFNYTCKYIQTYSSVVDR